MEHLNNIQSYEKLSEDPTERFSEEITSYLMSMFKRNILDRDTFEFLRPKFFKPGIPGRPIVSCCEAPSKGISKFVDHHHSPLVKNIPSYIKGTKDFLSKLRGYVYHQATC